jgi:hypothetical protein
VRRWLHNLDMAGDSNLPKEGFVFRNRDDIEPIFIFDGKGRNRNETTCRSYLAVCGL